MKKFDEEYKKEIDLEVPDLWDRIEAGVDAFEAEKKNEETGESPAKEETVIKNIRTKNNILYWVGRITAVAVCLIVVAVTVNTLRHTGSKSDSAPTAMNEAANKESMIAEEACEAPAESMSEVAYDEEPERPAPEQSKSESDDDRHYAPDISTGDTDK